MIRTKICCISSVAEARLAVHQGAGAVGLVSFMPSGPGVISESLIAEIAASVPPPVATVLLTSLVSPADIIAQQKRCRTNTIQICDRVAPGVYADLRAALPGVGLIQVIHVTGTEALEEALEFAPLADTLLLDTGNKSLDIKELGGTGKTHDWTVSAQIVSRAGVPVFLAGGLSPAIVAEAIREVRPFGVDVCSGVRTGDRLDEGKLAGFMGQVRAAI